MPSVRVTVVRDRNTVESDAFVLGETEPTPLTNGAGRMPGRAAYGDLTVVNGDVTVAAGEILEDKIIKGRVFLTWHATNPARMRNCEVQGPASPPTSGSAVPLVQINNLPTVMTSTTTQVQVEFVTIRPQTTSSYWDGIGRKGFKTVRCWIEDVNDGWQVFSTTTDGIIRAGDEGSCLTYFAQFQPDAANPRPVTHDDGVQNQGSLDEFVMVGTSINARPSTTRSNPLPPIRDELSAVMLNSNTQTRAGLRADKCWFRGGIYTINAGLSSGYVEITNSKFERPGTDTWAPDRAISINSGVTRVVTGNTYLDNGATVPVING
jgi:hypothetical protein